MAKMICQSWLNGDLSCDLDVLFIGIMIIVYTKLFYYFKGSVIESGTRTTVLCA